jgi:copper chaperone CopZ
MEFCVVGSNTMRCGGCESSVKFVLSTLSGVQDVEASHKTQRIQVQYEEAQPLEQAHVEEELQNLGYQVEVVLAS